MTPRPTNSLDLVEMVMTLEEAFDIEIPNDVLEHFGTPSELVDLLERLLSNQRPNKAAKLCSESSQRNNNSPSWRRGWRELGGVNK